MGETQQTISAWAAETFGEPGSLARVAARVNEELAELLRAYTAQQPREKIIEEAADTAIVLVRLGQRLGVDVEFRLRHPHSDLLRKRVETIRLAARSIGFIIEALMAPASGPQARARVQSWIETLAECLALFVRSYRKRIWPEIEAKMAINRKRVWLVDGSGHGYHQRSGEDVKHA